MPTLFENLFHTALKKAVRSLIEQCRKSEEGGENQTDFNVKFQIPAMENCLNDMLSIKVKPNQPDWQAYKNNLQNIFIRAQGALEKNIREQQGENGGNLSKALFDQFNLKIMNIFQEMLTTIETPPFDKHGNESAQHYNSHIYSQSPFINQLIYIALTYRFDKIQEKVTSKNKHTFSEIHKAKWDLLVTKINAWTELIDKKVEYISESVTGILKDLVDKEYKIQIGYRSTTSGIFKAVAGAATSFFSVENTDLGPKLQALRDRYIEANSNEYKAGPSSTPISF
jgi:hypothetical protein